MARKLEIDLPPGYEIVEGANGRKIVQKRTDQLLSKGISFRLTTEDHNHLLPLVESFPERSWSVAFRWLLDKPEVRAIIADRVNGATKKARP